MFFVCIFGCTKQMIDCECNDGIVLQNTTDTILCSKYPTKAWIYYKECDTLKSKDTLVYVSHGGFKRFITH